MVETYFRFYENKVDGRRIWYKARGYTAAVRSDVRFRRKVIFASKVVKFKVFGTLTYNDGSLPYSSKHVSKFFHRWRTYLSRLKIPRENLQYVWREDFGEKTGRPHFHFLASDFMDLQEARKAWGRGWIWLRKVYTINDVRRYLNKYMCKKREDVFNLKKHRYGTSRGVPPCPPSEWRLAGVCKKEDLMDLVYLHNLQQGHLDVFLGSKKN